jgi:putative ABC transport system substrate-binding protein
VRRREFITLVGGAAAWPLATRAQQRTIPVIGYMHGAATYELGKAFEQGLAESGYVNGTNVTIEYRWAEGHYDRLPAIAAEFVSRQVKVIAAGTPVAAIAAKQATTSIPIVFHIGGDPIKDGLVASLNRPGGNVTGATFFSDLLTAKRLGLLHELVPNARLFAALVNPMNPNAELETRDVEAAARGLGLQFIFSDAATEKEIERSIEYFGEKKANAVIVLSDAFLNGHGHEIRYGLPTCFAFREPVAAGGLMSYGASPTDTARLAGNYVGRVLNGEKPGDLPVLQPTKFSFVINMRAAKELGISVPNSMQLLADEVIE